MKKRGVIIWGRTGQAKVVRPIIERYGGRVVAVFDDNKKLKPPFSDIPLYHGKEGFEKWKKEKQRSKFSFCIADRQPSRSSNKNCSLA